jgi:hypothetical protein
MDHLKFFIVSSDYLFNTDEYVDMVYLNLLWIGPVYICKT